MELIKKLELNPIIAEVNSDIEVIFILKSTILTIEIMIKKQEKWYIYI